jgi:superfamily II DNA or RNA helicase
VFPPEFQFRHPWRAYQGRILADFDRHAADGHFHVVAAPGSGKTVLGLEVVRRLGRPALVCAPTLALRSQWIERLAHQFLAGERPAWVSEDVGAAASLTFETYQALHARARKGGIKALARTLRAAGVRTLVFDEAHHLKKEWWRTLDALYRALPGAFVVALTATPPYDVPQVEWNRYSALAGVVDAEISAAELVLVGDLCPHQDYVYLQRPTQRELDRVAAFDRQVTSFLVELSLDREIVQALHQHPALVDPQSHLDALLDEPEYMLSVAVFLKHADGVVPLPFLEALGLERDVLPPFDAWWAERLLQGALFRDAGSFGAHEKCLKTARARLRQMGALERRRVHLLSSPQNERALRASPAKLRAVADIVEAESRSLGEGLRLLVLTERIREHDLGASTRGADARRIGVVPLFDHLRRLRIPHVKLCAASGRVGIVPREIAPELEAALAGASSNPPCVAAIPVAPEFSRAALSGEDSAVFVRVVTQAFQEGRLTAIVGTTALLGEGWDAPALNTLVLATSIGSYVSTNQSRGRALRRSPQDPLKTANIWHPVCVDPRQLEHDDSELALLRRRFGTFMGPGLDAPAVESGIARLGLADGRLAPEAIDEINAAMFRHAEDRGEMADLWRRALVPGGKSDGRPVRETRLPRRIVSRVVIPFLNPGGRLAGWIERWRLCRRMTAIVRAVSEALVDAEVTSRSKTKLTLRVAFGEEKVAIQVVGMGTREEMLLHQALQDVFRPLFSPRYLLAGRRRAYPVPKVLGENREAADALCHRWNRRVDRAHLVSTRTPEGKRLLLKTVQRYLASHCRERADTGMRWERRLS